MVKKQRWRLTAEQKCSNIPFHEYEQLKMELEEMKKK